MRPIAAQGTALGIVRKWNRKALKGRALSANRFSLIAIRYPRLPLPKTKPATRIDLGEVNRCGRLLRSKIYYLVRSRMPVLRASVKKFFRGPTTARSLCIRDVSSSI